MGHNINMLMRSMADVSPWYEGPWFSFNQSLHKVLTGWKKMFLVRKLKTFYTCTNTVILGTLFFCCDTHLPIQSWYTSHADIFPYIWGSQYECLRSSRAELEHFALTSEWTLWTWECRFPFWEKEAGQNMQRWGFSPVCLAMWVCSTTFWLKALPQCVHL